MSFWQIFLLALIITFSGFTQGLSGFASTLVALPFLVLFMSIKAAVPLMGILAACMNLYLIFKLHEHIPWKKLPILLLSCIPGILLGVYVLKNFSIFFLQILLGIVLILFPLYEIFWNPVKKETNSRWEYLVGFVAGFLGGSLCSNSPAIVIYFSLQPWQKNVIKAIFVSFFFFCGVGIVISQALNGLVTPIVIRYFLISIPFLVIGTVLGHLCYQKISEVFYRKIITYLLLLSGVLTLYKAFA